jgi:hypothetical protein
LIGSFRICSTADIANNFAHWDTSNQKIIYCAIVPAIIPSLSKENNYKMVAIFVILFYDIKVKGGDSFV